MPPAVWTDPEARDRAVAALPDGRREQVAGSMARLFGPRDTEALLGTLGDAVTALRDSPDCDGHVASVGYCMGGNLSARLAARRPDLAGAVVFYGAPPSDEEILSIRCPVLGFYGGEDTRITSAVPGFAGAMKHAGLSFEPHVYAGAPPAFFNDTRRSYRPDAARDAWARCLMFFATQLRR